MADRQDPPALRTEADPYADFSTAEPGAAPTENDPYAEFSSPAPGALQKAGAAAEAGGKSALETSGALAGGAIGLTVGAATGPLAPVAMPVLGALGVAGGFLAGKSATGGLGLRSPEEMPPEVRPSAYFGEAVGGAAPMTGGTVAAAKAGFTTGRLFLDRILKFAGEHPVQFGYAETATSAYSGVGGALAEEHRPGEVGTRVAAEVGAGLLNPPRVISTMWSGASSVVRRAISQFSPAAQETLAGQYLQRIVTEFGEDPEVLSAILSQDSLFPGTTSAQKSGSDALIALEQKLSTENTKFGQYVAGTADRAMKAAGRLVDVLRGTGDPAALEAAAQAQSTRFRGLISARIQQAEAQAAEAAAGITADAPQARQQISRRAVEIVTDALKDARAVESSLWDKVPSTVRSAGDETIAAVQAMRGRMLPEESLPPLVEDFIARVSEGGTTTGELKILRSRTLKLAQEAAAQHRYSDAAIYGRIAEGALEDLTKTFENTGNIAFDDARTFSRELHQTFTRSFADAATATTRLGAERVPPEVFLQRALGSGKELGDVRLKDLREAAAFPSNVATKGPIEANPELGQRVTEMASAQERILRLAASDAIDPEKGTVNTRRLSTFLERNADLLDEFPAARDAIEKAITTQQGAANLRGVLENGERVAERQAAFAKVLKVDSPVDAVKKAINSAAPESELTGLFKVAAKGGEAAQEGLRFSLFEHAINRATSNEALDFEKLDKALNQPLRAGLPSVMEMMQRHGLADATTAENLNKIIAEGRKLAKASDPGAVLRGMDATPSMGLDALLRIAGSKAGGAVAQLMGGESTLIANSAGAKYLTETFKNMGGKNVMAFVLRAAEDPALMAKLLTKPKTEQEGLKLAQSIHAYAIAAGLSGAQSQPAEEPPKQ